MWSLLPFGLSSKSGSRGARRDKRFATNLLTTSLGEVVDISASGARIRCPGRAALAVGQVVPLTIRSPQSKVIVQSRVIRFGKAQRATEVSFAFLDAAPALREAITHLGRFGFIPRSRLSGSPDPVRRGLAPPLPDYYGLLGVSAKATARQVRMAYERLAREHHPDVARKSYSVGLFEALTQACQVLCDASLRAGYDAARKGTRLRAA